MQWNIFQIHQLDVPIPPSGDIKIRSPSLIIEAMQGSIQKIGVHAVLLFLTVPAVSASTAPFSKSQAESVPFVSQPQNDDAANVRDSMKQDVLTHPDDFITFETRSSAHRFLTDHEAEAHPETDRRVIARGVVGYWRGKTLVVLPSLSTVKPL